MTGNTETRSRVLNQELGRRQFLQRGSALVGLQAIGLGAILAACGGDDDSAGPGTGGDTAPDTDSVGASRATTLELAFTQDMQVPDPAVFYEGEGNWLMLSVYEGLLNYDYSNSNGDIVPQLAESYEVSGDGLTYTFHLRDGVTFHDGTPMDADSWIKAFERRMALEQGPSYMVADIASMEAPDPLTFIVHRTRPNNSFLDLLACPWRPKGLSPTAIAEHDVDGDLAQAWLSANSAGTGPYRITEFEPGSLYKLEYYDGYWGPAPEFTTINIRIIPDSSTQRLLLEQGDLDVARTLSFRDNVALQSDPKYQVFFNQQVSFLSLWINNTSGVLGADVELRQAIQSAIDRAAVLDTAYDGMVTPTEQFISPVIMREGLAPLNITFDPSLLKALAPQLAGTTLDLAYRDAGGPTYRLAAELIQTQLAAFGLDVTVRGAPTAEAFAWATGPADQRPDLFLATWGSGGDAMHPDGLRIFIGSGATSLNSFAYANPEVDQLLDDATAATDPDEIDGLYRRLVEILQAEAMVLPIGNDLVNITMRAGIGNVTFNPYIRYLIHFAGLTNA